MLSRLPREPQVENRRCKRYIRRIRTLPDHLRGKHACPIPKVRFVEGQYKGASLGPFKSPPPTMPVVGASDGVAENERWYFRRTNDITRVHNDTKQPFHGCFTFGERKI